MADYGGDGCVAAEAVSSIPEAVKLQKSIAEHQSGEVFVVRSIFCEGDFPTCAGEHFFCG